MIIEKHSRLRDKDGNKCDPEYCDKYIAGKPLVDKSYWAYGDTSMKRKGKE